MELTTGLVAGPGAGGRRVAPEPNTHPGHLRRSRTSCVRDTHAPRGRPERGGRGRYRRTRDRLPCNLPYKLLYNVPYNLPFNLPFNLLYNLPRGDGHNVQCEALTCWSRGRSETARTPTTSLRDPK